MKPQMMILSQLTHFLRFSVRKLCYQLFFIAVFISSQTPFYHSDSTIFISEDSYLYVESPVSSSSATSLSEKGPVLGKQFNTIKRKAFLKLKLSSVSRNHVNLSNQFCFIIPKSSHYIVNSNNPLSTAVLGNPSPIKLNHKISGSAFWVLPQAIVSKKKLLYHVINRFNLLKIITNHFSRPPPTAIKGTKVF